MLLGSIATLLIPVWILLFLLLLLGALALLGRVQNGRYLRPLFAAMAKVPLLRRWLQKMSQSAMERANPELASAMRKMQRSGALRDPQRAQQAMSQLTAQERRALLEMQEQQNVVSPEATNREMRRRLEKAQKQAKRGR
jgi:ABC-type transport system involved in cytochrome bd biosynthesis fused ATPase/permease subunit